MWQIALNQMPVCHLLSEVFAKFMKKKLDASHHRRSVTACVVGEHFDEELHAVGEVRRVAMRTAEQVDDNQALRKHELAPRGLQSVGRQLRPLVSSVGLENGSDLQAGVGREG